MLSGCTTAAVAVLCIKVSIYFIPASLCLVCAFVCTRKFESRGRVAIVLVAAHVDTMSPDQHA